MTQVIPFGPMDVAASQNYKVNVQVLAHVVAAPPNAPLSPPAVRRATHDAVVEAFRRAEPMYEGAWKIVSDDYPAICIHLMGPSGPLLGILVDAAEYDSNGLGITLTDVTFRGMAIGVPCKAQSDHPPLVYSGEPGLQRAWFCLPGTREFHRQYADLEPFAIIRDKPEANPVEILMRCLSTIDTEALAKGKGVPHAPG